MIMFMIRLYLFGWGFIFAGIIGAFLLRGWVDKQLEAFFDTPFDQDLGL